jgi:hypothetical protein
VSEFMFGVRRGKLSDDETSLRDRIAEKHHITHNYIRGADQEWLSGPNRGDPFDRELACALDEIATAEGSS